MNWLVRADVFAARLVNWLVRADVFAARPVNWLVSMAMLVAKVLLMLVSWVVRVEIEARREVGSKEPPPPLPPGGSVKAVPLKTQEVPPLYAAIIAQLLSVLAGMEPFRPGLLFTYMDATPSWPNVGGRGPTSEL